MCVPEWSTEYMATLDDDGEHSCDLCKSEEENDDGDQVLDALKFLEAHKDWPYQISKQGLDIAIKWQQQMENRIPDLHDCYFYNDFASDGAVEVMENVVCVSEFLSTDYLPIRGSNLANENMIWQVLTLKKELERDKNRPMYAWHELEGFALFASDAFLYLNMHCDGERVQNLLKLVAQSVMVLLAQLHKQDRFDKKTNLTNITSTCMELYRFGDACEDIEPSASAWKHAMYWMLAGEGRDMSLVRDAEKKKKLAQYFWNLSKLIFPLFGGVDFEVREEEN
jgi:hypothetical protein